MWVAEGAWGVLGVRRGIGAHLALRDVVRVGAERPQRVLSVRALRGVMAVIHGHA